MKTGIHKKQFAVSLETPVEMRPFARQAARDELTEKVLEIMSDGRDYHEHQFERSELRGRVECCEVGALLTLTDVKQAEVGELVHWKSIASRGASLVEVVVMTPRNLLERHLFRRQTFRPGDVDVWERTQ